MTGTLLMATAAPPDDRVVIVRRRHPAVTAAKWTGIGLLALVLLLAAFLVWLNTDPGRRYVVRQINNFETASGLEVDGRPDRGLGVRRADPPRRHAQRPQGRLLPRAAGRARLAALRLFPQPYRHSLAARSPRRGSTGSPSCGRRSQRALAARHRHRHRPAADRAALGRSGGHRAAPSAVGRQPDPDRRRAGRRSGSIAARSPRPGLPGGDRVALRLDAVPEANRLDLRVAARGPADGFVAGLLGLDQAVVAELDGRGDWANWRGRAARRARRPRLRQPRRHRRATAPSRSTGPMRPGLVLSGPLQRLAGPTALVNLVTTVRQPPRRPSPAAEQPRAGARRRRPGRSRPEPVRESPRRRPADPARSDRAQSQRPRRPARHGPQRRASRRPCVAYDLRAGRLTLRRDDDRGAARASAAPECDADDIVIPVSATARRIIGFDAVAGGPITNVRHGRRRSASAAADWSPTICGSAPTGSTPRLALAFDLAAGHYLAGDPGTGEQLSGRGSRPVRPHHRLRHGQRRPRLRPARPGRGAHPADRQCDHAPACSAAPRRRPPTSR